MVYVKRLFSNKHGWSNHERDVLYISLVTAALAALGIIQVVVDDVPSDVQLQLARAAYINDKIIDKIADEDEEPLSVPRKTQGFLGFRADHALRLLAFLFEKSIADFSFC